MLFTWKWPWRRRGRTQPARRPGAAPRTRLLVEALEDRLALSTNSLDFTGLTHDQWREQRFALNEAVIVDPQQVVNPQSVQTAAMQGANLIGLDRVFANYPYRGDNYSVAVIDTGIDYNHSALGGGWGQRVVAGWDFANNDADPMDDHGHGTHVAGIIGSSNTTYTGIAPNVKFIALKVLGADGSGSFAAVEDALQWVINHQAQYNIVSVNMSLGAGNFATDAYQFLDNEFVTLKNQGVFIAAASGNSFYGYNSQQGLGYPAISNYAVAVGAVWAGNFGAISWMSGAQDYTTAADRITSFTQRSAALDILAPGALITSAYRGGGWATMAGTSMATPMIAGAAAILHQALDTTGNGNLANQDYILSLMRSTGATVVDGDDENDNVVNTGLTFKRIDLFAALDAIQESNANHAPTLDPIADQTISWNQNSLTVTLSYSDADGDAVSLAARAYTAAGSPVGMTATFDGNQMTLQSLGVWPASFSVEVTASDGTDQTSRTFTVSLVNNAPVLAPIANQTMKWNQGSLTVDLVYSDPDGDALVFYAQTRAVPNQAYQLKEKYGLSYVGTYATNYYGQNEKWLRGSNNQYYCILSNGQLRRWAGNMSATLRAANLVATFDPTFYADPSKLWNARAAATPEVICTFQGDQLVVTPPAGYLGSFLVDVFVSDGRAVALRTFSVAVTNNAPTLAAIPNQTMPAGVNQLTVELSASDADGDALTITAHAKGIASQAYQVKQQLGLYYIGTYLTNFHRHNEKWLRGSGGKWYCLLPNGQLRRWAGSMYATLQASNLIATFDASFYADPSKLWNAQPPVNPTVQLTVEGNRLTINRPNGFVGTFQVVVAITDGCQVAKRTFLVTVG